MLLFRQYLLHPSFLVSCSALGLLRLQIEAPLGRTLGQHSRHSSGKLRRPYGQGGTGQAISARSRVSPMAQMNDNGVPKKHCSLERRINDGVWDPSWDLVSYLQPGSNHGQLVSEEGDCSGNPNNPSRKTNDSHCAIPLQRHDDNIFDRDQIDWESDLPLRTFNERASKGTLENKSGQSQGHYCKLSDNGSDVTEPRPIPIVYARILETNRQLCWTREFRANNSVDFGDNVRHSSCKKGQGTWEDAVEEANQRFKEPKTWEDAVAMADQRFEDDEDQGDG